MLPVLREAGVVDAGGQGLLYFMEGFAEALAYDNELSLEWLRLGGKEADEVRPAAELFLSSVFATALNCC